MVIYCHSMVITTVIWLYNTEWWYYHGMAVKYLGKKFYNISPRSGGTAGRTLTKDTKIEGLNLATLAPGANVIKQIPQ
jgi:hypothetical protein